MYTYFTKLESCSLNIFFITSTLVLSVTVTITAILPWIQKVQPKSGWFQAALISGYCTYQTWSAISGEPYGPDRNCHINGSSYAVFANNGNALAASIIGIVVLLISIAYMSFYLSSTENLRRFIGISKNEVKPSGESDGTPTNTSGESDGTPTNTSGGSDGTPTNTSGESDGTPVPWWKPKYINDEEKKVAYIYSVFHFLMLISVLYLMMHLTNWAYPGEVDSDHFQNSWASVWVKMATVWICFGVYEWTLLAPLVLAKCRKFE
ncbi:Serine incorporator 3 [Geodia barretti]|uniref:Serine incorporator 3 n=1 Tax=Geodia barretti TaxID=519541 RepID=A0AA35TRH2_GEOBA|nr:Serine incorporator 3 [Geodia barretti]